MTKTIPLPVLAAAVLAIAAGVILSGISANYVDDALITFQYAENLAFRGELTWWPGQTEPVDGFTSLLHVLLLAGGVLMGADVALANSVVCFGSYLGIVALYVYATAQYALFPRIAGLAVVALNASFLFWLSGGLDGLLFTFLFFATYVAVEQADGGARFGFKVALALTLLALTRPEGVLIAIALVLYHWGLCLVWRERRPELFWPLTVLATIAAQVVWRLTTYGSIVPNTFFAKRSASFTTEIVDGALYVGHWLMTAGGMLILTSAFVWLLVVGTRLREFMVMGLIALVVVEGGDPHPMFRFLMPIIPLIALDTARLLEVGSRVVRVSVVVLLAGYLANQVTASLAVQGRIAGQQEIATVIDRIKDGTWPFRTVRDDRIADFRALAVAEIDKIVPQSLPVVGTDVGALAYFSDQQTIDAAGLNDRVIAHLPKPEGVHNRWGAFRLDYLAEQNLPIMVLSFPSLTETPLGEGVPGRACTATELRVAHHVATFRDHLLPHYQCAASQGDGGRWVNFLVRNAAADALPTETLIRQCIPDLIAHCN